MRSKNKLTIALTTALLVFVSAAIAVSQEAELEEEVTLLGQLSEDADGGYVLVDPESGDEVSLRGQEEALAEHLGSAVAVTGRWAEDDEAGPYFAVSAVEAQEA